MIRSYIRLRADGANMRFYGECPVCGGRRYSRRLPVICRHEELLPRLDAGGASARRQKAFDRRRAAAAKSVARYFNRCSGCGGWVCDGCYDADDGTGACISCSGKNKRGISAE